MTVQTPEILILNGQSVGLQSEPLYSYFEQRGITSPFCATSTAQIRGYRGTWEIVEKRLYLVALQATYEDGSPAGLESLFPGVPGKVFAVWYSGRLHVVEGHDFNCAPSERRNLLARTSFIHFENGVAKYPISKKFTGRRCPKY